MFESSVFNVSSGEVVDVVFADSIVYLVVVDLLVVDVVVVDVVVVDVEVVEVVV